MKEKICCFIGHQKIKDPEQLRQKLYPILERLIADEGFDTFLFGSMSQLYPLCHEVVTQLREKYPHIRRIYVRAEYPFIDTEFKNQILQDYEDTYFARPTGHSDQAEYVDRNCHMVCSSSTCVFYFNTKGKVRHRKFIRNDQVLYRPQSGTKIVYDYAVKKGKRIINIHENA